MKKAFSIIELIFTIIIMGMFFLIIPKIIFTMNKGDSFVIQQDSILNGVSFIKRVVFSYSWDENNTKFYDILHTYSKNELFDCNESNNNIRIGTYLSSNARNCENNLFASIIGKDSNETNIDDFDDIDDFDKSSIDVNKNGKKIYKLFVNVNYMDDSSNVFKYNGENLIIDLNASHVEQNSTNIKLINVVVGYQGGRGKDKNLTSYHYYSTNIGEFTLLRIDW